MVKNYPLPHWADVEDRTPITGDPIEYLRRSAPEEPEPPDSVSDLLLQKLDAMAASLEQAFSADERRRTLVARVTAVTGVALSAGFVVWILRSGTLLASCLASLPAWRRVDPLPVLSLNKRERNHFRQETHASQQREQVEFRGLREVLRTTPRRTPKV